MGCNYVNNSINLIETWQEYNFEETYKVMDKELSLAACIGMNSVRMLLPFDVWKYQCKGFLSRFDKFLDLLGSKNMTLMPIFFDDCGRCPEELYTEEIQFGPQPSPVPGCHGGFPPRKKIKSKNPAFHMADIKENWPLMEEFVKEIVGLYAKDHRIIAWDIWNEPGNSGADGVGNVNKSMEIMEKVFNWVREMDPIQPLTAGCWDFYTNYETEGVNRELTPIEKRALELSDVISFHFYGDIERTKELISYLKMYGRPLFITEWLHRPLKNYVSDHLPLFKEERIACYSWGLVNGKTQTHESWYWIKSWPLDFSEWQHDLFKSDGTPYKKEEIKLFRKLTKEANVKKCPVRAVWDTPVLVREVPHFNDSGKDSRLGYPGLFGCEYDRMVILKDGLWLAVYTIYDNDGYKYDADGGTALEFSLSRDEGKTWEIISRLDHPSRDLDNGQMIVMENSDILLACRSVRWQESYQLPVYKSRDSGRTWEFLSMIDENNGPPGALGNPDKGMYEPHFFFLDDGSLSVMYANEKHVTEKPYYSQIISQRISKDGGKTWGEEIFAVWDPAQPQLRPGMPVWTKLKDRRYMVVFEVVDLRLTVLNSAQIYYKTSPDGVTWKPGIGKEIPLQSGGPFIEQLPDGEILVTSLSGEISISTNSGKSWNTIRPLPFKTHTWPSLYSLGDGRFALLNGCRRKSGGNNVQICIGRLVKEGSTS